MNYTNTIKEDESFVMNMNDDHLVPIRISLPKAPLIKYIDGNELNVKDQRFKRMEAPKELIDLEKEAIRKCKTDCEKKRESVSPYKVYKTFWDLFESKQDELVDGVSYLKKMWWHRIHGYWFMNHGKPTYITGKHFDFLHFWTIPEDNFARPNFRDRDRRWYLYMDYLEKCTETFRDLDANGKALKVDGKFHMIDLGKRVFFGGANTKQRRAGETHKSLSWGHSVTTTKGGSNVGMISYSKDQIEGHWKKKFIPAWGKIPVYMLPASQSTSASNSVEYTPPQTAYGEDFVYSQIDYAKTSNQSAMDGTAYSFVYVDEPGKTTTVSVLKRWNTIRFCLVAGKVIKGFSLHPSTVEELEKGGGQEFKALLDQSDFYVRKKDDGQTISGLGMTFLSACDGLEGAIDSYGYSVAYEVTDWQKEEGFTSCAFDSLKAERDLLMLKYEQTGDPNYLESYRALQRKFPLVYMDSFIGDAGELLPSVYLDKAIIRCETAPLSERPKKYTLMWDSGIKFSRVIAKEDPDGKWLISEMPEDREQNQSMIEVATNNITGEWYDRHRPSIQSSCVVGVDPTKWHSGSRIKQANAKRSKPAIHVFKMKTIEDDRKNNEEWEGYKTVCTYCHMPQFSDDFSDDVVKTAWFWSSYVYPEANTQDVLMAYVETNCCDGYFLYDVNKKGQEKDYSGSHTSLENKSTGMSTLSDYIKLRWKSEKHLDFLQQCKQMKSLEDLTNQDLVAAALKSFEGMAIIKRRNGLKPQEDFDPFAFIEEWQNSGYMNLL